ncbi:MULTISPECIES: Rv3235 family protein [unclassified Luteococcus]|uniref:Rv3235 family protein n=1 Tax=unclassified Luteococcus TaxID=2639923 RepID=UPI00313AE7FC
MNRPTQLSVHGQQVLLMAPDLPDPTLPDLPHPFLPTGHDAGIRNLALSPRQPSELDADDATEADRLVRSIGTSLLEVLQRRRPASQLAMWMAEPCHLLLVAWSRQREWLASRLVGVRSCRVSPTVLEGTVMFADQQRLFTVLLRLEQRYGRWHVTVFEVMLPPAAQPRCA